MNSTTHTSLQDGKYVIKRVLGQSGLSVTLQGVHGQSNRLVVLKTLKSVWKQQPNFLLIKQRFEEQVNRFARCQHPGLVRIIDAFEENGLPFAVMDYTPGQTLQQIIATQGPLPEERATQYIQQVGSALLEVHQHGLIHRDVTPKNIIHPTNTNIVVLTNFGLTDASTLGLSSEKIPPLAGPYAAIEQYQTQFPITPATDIYALAGTLYFLLTGHSPLSAPRRGDSKLPNPRQYCPQLSSTLEVAILRGLELNPKKRPEDVASWLSLLVQVASPTVAPVAQSSVEKVLVNTYSSKVNKEHSASSKTSPTRSEVSSKRKVLQSPVNSSSAIATSKYFPKVVLSTALIAASVGLGIGLMLRIAANSTGPGASFFHSEQSFPVLNNWPGSVDPVEPPSAYSAPKSYNTPISSPPVRSSQPSPPVFAPSAPEVAPLPEQAAEETLPPVTEPAPEAAPPPASFPSSSEAVPEPAPVPVEPAPPDPPPVPDPPVSSSQTVPADSAPTGNAPN